MQSLSSGDKEKMMN